MIRDNPLNSPLSWKTAFISCYSCPSSLQPPSFFSQFPEYVSIISYVTFSCPLPLPRMLFLWLVTYLFSFYLEVSSKMDTVWRGLPKSLHVMLNLLIGNSCLDHGLKDSETESRLERVQWLIGDVCHWCGIEHRGILPVCFSSLA